MKHIKKLILSLVLGMLWLNPALADNTCVDKNPEIILDLGGDTEPEKIIYATYDACTKMHDYCGTLGCSLDVIDHDSGSLGYLVGDDWYIRPSGVRGEKPSYELVIPVANDNLRIIKVIGNKLTATIVSK